MWRDGLTVIGLDSRLPNRPPDYLTFDAASAGGGVEVTEAAAQEVPTVEATTGPMAVPILGGYASLLGAMTRPCECVTLEDKRRGFGIGATPHCRSEARPVHSMNGLSMREALELQLLDES
jgi:hypothetical protein